MAKRTEDRYVKMECTICKQHVPRTHKNKKKITERMERKKYCPVCKKHTPHKETK